MQPKINNVLRTTFEFMQKKRKKKLFFETFCSSKLIPNVPTNRHNVKFMI